MEHGKHYSEAGFDKDTFIRENLVKMDTSKIVP
jgi:hypothetical protein